MSFNPNNPNCGGAGLKDVGPTLPKQVSKASPDNQPEVKVTGSGGSKPKLTTGGQPGYLS